MDILNDNYFIPLLIFFFTHIIFLHPENYNVRKGIKNKNKLNEAEATGKRIKSCLCYNPTIQDSLKSNL